LPEREIDFGFLFCRVCHFYSMSYWDVMKLPIKSFWLMSENVRRIQAENDMRAVSVAANVQSPEGLQEFHEKLVIELGEVSKEPIVPSAERDQEGFNELRMLAAAMMG